MMTSTEIAILPKLGVQFAEFVRLERIPRDRAEKDLAAIKVRVNKCYRRAAFELHPDRTKGDPVKTQDFIAVTNLSTKIQRMAVTDRRQVVYEDSGPEVVAYRFEIERWTDGSVHLYLVFICSDGSIFGQMRMDDPLDGFVAVPV